jgi:hypothetical protein
MVTDLRETRIDPDKLPDFHAALLRQAREEPLIEELWRAQDERDKRERQEQLRAEWAEHHLKMHSAHMQLAEDHAKKRAHLLSADWSVA